MISHRESADFCFLKIESPIIGTLYLDLVVNVARISQTKHACGNSGK